MSRFPDHSQGECEETGLAVPTLQSFLSLYQIIESFKIFVLHVRFKSIGIKIYYTSFERMGDYSKKFLEDQTKEPSITH